jgi:pyruvate/2-oxoacid:ferredoxin oxidoreductase beta subunit
MSTALSIKGMRFLLLHSPCPTGWKSEPEDSIELVRLAVASGLFPVYKEIDLDATRRTCSERMQRLQTLAKQYPPDK